MKLSNIQEMTECAKTLTNWKQEILNSFHWYDGRRLSNGPIEGKNNYKRAGTNSFIHKTNMKNI